MRPLNLMVDIDEVIFPMIDTVHAIAHELGLHDNSQPMRTWEGWRQYGCTEEAYWDVWRVFHDRNGYLETPPIPSEIQALRDLAFDGHRINLVTARGFMANAEPIRQATQAWVEEFAVPHVSLTFAKDKPGTQRILGRFDGAVDDSPRNVARLRADGVPTWLMSHPHNEGMPDDARVYSIAQWRNRLEAKYGDTTAPHLVRGVE